LVHAVQSSWFEADYHYWKTLADRCKEKQLISFSAPSTAYKDIVQLFFELSQEDSRYLIKTLPEETGLRIHEFLLAVYVLALKTLHNGDAVLLHLEGHGREACIEGVDVSRTVGWFTSIVPVLVDLSVANETESTPLEVYQIIAKQLRELPNNGIGFGLLRGLREGAAPKWVKLLRDSKLKFNYLGQFQEVAGSQVLRSKSKWNDATISPDNQPDYLLFLQALVQEGRLHCELRYNSTVFESQEMHQLASICQQRIHSVIGYLKSKVEQDDDQFDTLEF
jgi:non-ribosomal peptide synthase protein (TIGR01720 family)